MAGGFSAVWSPDGSRIVFASARNGIADLYERSPTGEGNEQLILQTSQGKWPWDWSRDGRFISFTSDSIQTKTDLWILPLGGERKPLLFRQTPANELGGMFSPDQKWIAYSSDESGRWEVYVESFNLSQLDQKAPSRRRWQVSSHGGFQPLWRRDGKELFYISSDVSPRDWWTQGRPGGRLMAVDVKLGPQFTTGVPRELFRARFPDQAAPITYAATADGQRFLINTLVAVETPVTVLLNWQPPR
jgi:Tol biopolymer transport system component